MPVGDRDTQRILDLQRSMVGGTMLATDIALSTGSIAINLGGGFHHARADVGRGFCVFNDVAVAIAEQRALGFHGKVLVIDLDMHDGDGTRTIFAADRTVHTLSIHNQDWDSAAARRVHQRRPRRRGRRRHLPRRRAHPRQRRPAPVPAPADLLRRRRRPGRTTTPIGDWPLSDDGMLARDEAVFELVRHLAPDAALVVTLAGGYGPNAWRHSARSFAWLQSGHHGFRAPANDELSLMRARHLARLLSEEELTGGATTSASPSRT
jgi:acetoin utilization deacetylase AcuC-like enzyme